MILPSVRAAKDGEKQRSLAKPILINQSNNKDSLYSVCNSFSRVKVFWTAEDPRTIGSVQKRHTLFSEIKNSKTKKSQFLSSFDSSKGLRERVFKNHPTLPTKISPNKHIYTCLGGVR